MDLPAIKCQFSGRPFEYEQSRKHHLRLYHSEELYRVYSRRWKQIATIQQTKKPVKIPVITAMNSMHAHQN